VTDGLVRRAGRTIDGVMTAQYVWLNGLAMAAFDAPLGHKFFSRKLLAMIGKFR